MILWKKINGYPNYEISSDGHVLNIITGKFLKQSDNGKGYLKIELFNNGKGKNLYIHRLVAEAFLLKYQQKCEVNHIDGNKYNNDITNLEWCSRQQNINHAVNNRLHNYGSKIGTSKLRNKDILKIRYLYKNGIAEIELAKRYNITRRNINYIINYITWRHLP